jgi:hypothetical protein
MAYSVFSNNNAAILEQRWNLVRGTTYVVSLYGSGFIAEYKGFGHFQMADGRDSYPMPAHVQDVTPYEG